MEYIDKETALKALCEYCQEKETCDRHSHWNGRCTEYADIDAIPAADVAPVRRGKWIIRDKHIYQCNRCGNYLDIRGLNGGRGDANYCPNCGAKME